MLSHTKASSVRFDGVHLVDVALDESTLSNLVWHDVVCERCNLSMVNWRGAKLTRAVVRGCRVTGGKLIEGDLESVRFTDCQLDYASFADTRFRHMVFESCQLREANFHGADLAGTRFVECDLQKADFAGAKLHSADVSTSNLDGVTVGAGEVRGLIVSRQQAADLARLLVSSCATDAAQVRGNCVGRSIRDLRCARPTDKIIGMYEIALLIAACLGFVFASSVAYRGQVRGVARVLFVIAAVCVPALAVLNMTTGHEVAFVAAAVLQGISIVGFFITVRRKQTQ